MEICLVQKSWMMRTENANGNDITKFGKSPVTGKQR